MREVAFSIVDGALLGSRPWSNLDLGHPVLRVLVSERLTEMMKSPVRSSKPQHHSELIAKALDPNWIYALIRLFLLSVRLRSTKPQKAMR